MTVPRQTNSQEPARCRMILLNDFRAEPEELLVQELAAIERVLRSGWYIVGEEVKSFETAWAQYCDRAFAVGVGTGMDALEIGLRTLGLEPEDEVVTTPMTAFATVLAVMRAGATPVLADIDPMTALLDLESVERCLTPRTRVVLPVHLYGQVCDMDRWREFCDERGLYLVEDCAQAHGARWNNRPAGSFGEWGAFSFYPTKNLGTVGDGGALTTDRQDVATTAAMLRNYGQADRYHHPVVGLNSRLDELHAAILSVRLEWLERFSARRREIAQTYQAGVRNPLIRLLAPPPLPENHVYHLYVVCCRERERLAAFLSDYGIRTLIHYPIPVHRQPPCEQLNCDPQGLPNAERHARECLSIPCHPQLSDADVRQVIAALNEFR